MTKFWQFFWLLLRHRSLLVVLVAGMLLDALCAFAGFGSIVAIIHQLVDREETARTLVEKILANEYLIVAIGDQSHWATWIPPDPFEGFAATLLAVFVLAIIGSVGRFVHQYTAITLTSRTIMKIRKNVFQRIVHTPLIVMLNHSTADKLSRIMRDTGQLSRGFNTLIGKAPRKVLQGLAALGMALLVDWYLTVIFLIGFPLIGTILYTFGRKIRKASKRALVQNAAMIKSVQEGLQAMRVVKVHQAEGYERRRFNRINRTLYNREMRARLFRALTNPSSDLIAMAGIIVVALIAAYPVFHEKADSAGFIAVLGLLAMAGGALTPLGNLNNDLQDASAAAERVDELLHIPVEPNVRRGADRSRPSLPRHRESVTLENVTYTYPTGNRPAVRDVQLTVRRGQVCAIVGGNGSGKSTLVGLLPRLYDPQSGRVLIDGKDIAEHSLRSLRSQMAMVTQETILFDGTIAENLTYGYRHVSEERMIEASRRAYAHEFILETPHGYDTSVGEFGGRLSGGQRQRIAIARAILRDPAILILDEATSQIDADSEAKIADALNDFTSNRTTFVIAHRLSTVVNADMIVVMEDGRIASIGKHEELLEKSDVYRVLCQTQLHGLNGT